MKILPALFLIFAATFTAFSQTASETACFSISNSGSPPRAGEIYKFTLAGPPGFDWTSVKLKWTVTPQLDLTGSNTREVSFKWDRPDKHGTITASVEIEGAPGNCAKLLTETMSWHGPPDPVKVGVWKKGQAPTTHHQFAEELTEHPDNQGYVFIIRGPTSTQSSFANLTTIIRNVAKNQVLDTTRVTIVEAEGFEELAEFWRVPPGAENPECTFCKTAICPDLKIVVPDGVISTGELAEILLNIDPAPTEPVSADWEVSSGTIENGQGTRRIALRIARDAAGLRVTATARVRGLPTGCRSTASGELLIQPIQDPVMFDEFGRLPLREERQRIGAAAVELLNNPGFTAYFILYRGPDESPGSEATRMDRIVNHLVKTRKIPRERFVVVSGGKFVRSTKVYMVPPGAPKPAY
jgi:hypothetical protein